MKKPARRFFLKTGGLVAAVLAASAACICNSNSIRRITLEGKTMQAVDLKEQNKRKVYRQVEAHLYNFFAGNEKEEGYVNFMSKHSSEVQKNLKARGHKSVVEGYIEVHRKCLDLAMIKAGKAITEEDLDVVAENLVVHMEKEAKDTPIDYLHPAVKEGCKEFTKSRAGFFKKLIERNIENPRGDYRELVRKAFSREEYEKEFKAQQTAKIKLYGGFEKSFENYTSPIPGWAFLVKTFGPGIVRRTKEKSEEYNKKRDDIWDK